MAAVDVIDSSIDAIRETMSQQRRVASATSANPEGAMVDHARGSVTERNDARHLLALDGFAAF